MDEEKIMDCERNLGGRPGSYLTIKIQKRLSPGSKQFAARFSIADVAF